MTFALTFLLLATGALISTMAGFGFAVATMPFLILLHPPKTAVLLTLFVGAIGAFIQWLRIRRDADYRLAALLLLGGLAGLPLGAWVLIAVSTVTVKLLVSVAVLAAVVLNLLYRPTPGAPPLRPTPLLCLVTGAMTGLLTTSISQPGLAVALLFAWSRLDKVTARATLYSVFVPLNATGVALLIWQGTLGRDIVQSGLWLVPAYLVGITLGEIGFRRLSQQSFRYMMLGILAVSGTAGMVNSLVALVSLF